MSIVVATKLMYVLVNTWQEYNISWTNVCDPTKNFYTLCKYFGNQICTLSVSRLLHQVYIYISTNLLFVHVYVK